MNSSLPTIVTNITTFITSQTGIGLIVIGVTIAWICVVCRFLSARHAFESTASAAFALSAAWIVNNLL